jgi:hypothetical protein
MITFQDVEELAKDSIVFALEERRFVEDVVAPVVAANRVPAPMPPMPPAVPVDLDQAFEEFIQRYPQTLEYLAK